MSSAICWVTSSLAFVHPGSPAGAAALSTLNCKYLVSLVFTEGLAALEVAQLLLAEQQVLLQLVIHVLLPLQLLLAALIQALHLLELGVHPCVL